MFLYYCKVPYVYTKKVNGFSFIIYMIHHSLNDHIECNNHENVIINKKFEKNPAKYYNYKTVSPCGAQ